MIIVTFDIGGLGLVALDDVTACGCRCTGFTGIQAAEGGYRVTSPTCYNGIRAQADGNLEYLSHVICVDTYYVLKIFYDGKISKWNKSFRKKHS